MLVKAGDSELSVSQLSYVSKLPEPKKKKKTQKWKKSSYSSINTLAGSIRKKRTVFESIPVPLAEVY
jgi:hypothetical protein